MAAVLRRNFGAGPVTLIGKTNSPLFLTTRFKTKSFAETSSQSSASSEKTSSTSSVSSTSSGSDSSVSSNQQQDPSKGWFRKLVVRYIEPAKESHSQMLSDKEIIYALNTHNIRPDSVDKYLVNYERYVDLIHSHKEQLNCKLIGSWTVEVGDMDQALHLWQYSRGYECVDKARKFLSNNEDYKKLVKEQGSYLRSRHSQYLLAFSYWPAIEKRDGSNIYEIRSYRLKPGTMIEWGNNWAKAINFRLQNNESFAGFFSQVGRLYNVHHIWCYKDLNARKETRASAWEVPGWDECVAHTVPLMQELHSRILLPTSFSPTK